MNTYDTCTSMYPSGERWRLRAMRLWPHQSYCEICMAEDAALIPTSSIRVIHRPSPRSPPRIFRISSLIVIRLPPTQHQLASPAASEVRAHGFPTGTSLDDHGGLELEPDHDRNAAGRTSEGAVQVCRVQTSSSGGFGLEHQSGRMANGHPPSIGHHLRVSVSQPWS